jgi:hypothetical protein
MHCRVSTAKWSRERAKILRQLLIFFGGAISPTYFYTIQYVSQQLQTWRRWRTAVMLCCVVLCCVVTSQ